MIISIVEEARLSGAKDEKHQYPIDSNTHPKLDCATEEPSSRRFHVSLPKGSRAINVRYGPDDVDEYIHP